MDNNKMLPFERNRYYTGKLLTATDFQTEQVYNGSKRRFINHLMFGSGVVCGLGVYNLDDLSVIIESGVAIDGLGHEIVLENSLVKKLSTIEGFDKLSSDRAGLFIRYEEEETHPVFSVNSDGGEDYQCNRVREEFKLMLLDLEQDMGEKDFQSEFLNREKIYRDNDYSIFINMPAYAPIDSSVKVDVEVVKTSYEEKQLDAEFTLITPAFTNGQMEHAIKVKFQNVSLLMGEKFLSEHWVNVSVDKPMKTTVTVEQNSVNIVSGSEVTKGVDKFYLAVEITDEGSDDIVTREIGKVNLENRGFMRGQEYVCLAEIQLIRTDSLFIIGGLSDRKVKRYICSEATSNIRKAYEAYYSQGRQEREETAASGGGLPFDISTVLREQANMTYASGVLEIPLDIRQKSGDVVFSDEIVHGLGKGNVYVDVGVEYVAEDRIINQTAENVIYGEFSLFEGAEVPFAHVKTAVKVMPGRGSFIAAAKLLKETDLVLLKFRWNAIKFAREDKSETLNQLGNMKIVAETPTVVLGTKESHYFNVKFQNMPPCSVNYQLTEEGSGDITIDGIYTAPAKEGVYEIVINCVDYPFLSTYAYAVVKRKGIE